MSEREREYEKKRENVRKREIVRNSLSLNMRMLEPLTIRETFRDVLTLRNRSCQREITEVLVMT